MIRVCLCLLAGISGLSVCSSTSVAQSSSIFGNRGPTSTTGTQSNGMGGNQNQTAYGGGGSLTGFTGANGSASSSAGFASGAATGGGLAGRATTGFVGNRNASNSAVQNGQVNMNGTAGNGARGALGNAGGRMNQNRNRQNQNNNANSGGAKSAPIRPAQVIAFQPPPRTAEGLTTAISSNLAYAVSQGRIPTISPKSGVGVLSDAAGNVTITGNVASSSDRKKAEAMVRLEPGVRHIDNQITVGQ